MKNLIAVGAVVTALVTGGGAAWAAVGDAPGPGTIVDVSGDADNGFTIEHYDGSTDYPPTLSEARAECEEYRHHVSVVRCRTHVRVWYRGMGRLKRALDYAHAQ
ncbi:hypothetical protein ACT8ZV_03545 [Nocardioides sp. MAHUQ-72]|uniref:hypothetical protein n=1 Tax=unclassified Nocardioides TaxID=2615069 RepID=UPI003620F23D